MKKYDVVIVDDHLLFAQSLKGLVDSFEEFNVLFHANNGQELVDKLNTVSNTPHIVLMDVNMPVMNGIEATAWLRKNKPEIKVLALSMEDDENLIIKMIKKGARGYLLKDIHPTELQTALQEVIDDGFYHTKHVSKILQKSMHGMVKNESQLSDNELRLLELVCSEKTYAEIANEMYLSPKTIDGYRESLFKKIGVKSRVGLVLYAIKNGLYQL
ncbi:MAG: response regulator transcription factor [Flavobacteriaceae bacterium]|nr:response regulator transcription factor [Flavobacteriaceae bacterium]